QDARDAEVIDDVAYQAGLAKLRTEYGAAVVDALLDHGVPPAQRTHTQHIREYTSIQAAIAGDVHGDIYIVGERAESTKAPLAGEPVRPAPAAWRARAEGRQRCAEYQPRPGLHPACHRHYGRARDVRG